MKPGSLANMSENAWVICGSIVINAGASVCPTLMSALAMPGSAAVTLATICERADANALAMAGSFVWMPVSVLSRLFCHSSNLPTIWDGSSLNSAWNPAVRPANIAPVTPNWDAMPPILPIAAPTPFTATPNPFNAPEDTFNAAEPMVAKATFPADANGLNRPARRDTAPPTVADNPTPTVFAADVNGANGFCPLNEPKIFSARPSNGSDNVDTASEPNDLSAPLTVESPLPTADQSFDMVSLMPFVSSISSNAVLNSDAQLFTFSTMESAPDSTAARMASIFVLTDAAAFENASVRISLTGVHCCAVFAA